MQCAPKLIVQARYASDRLQLILRHCMKCPNCTMMQICVNMLGLKFNPPFTNQCKYLFDNSYNTPK